MSIKPATKTSIQSDAEKEIIELSADKYKWYVERKIESVEDLFDDELVFVHINGHISNKKEWIGEMRSGRFVYDEIILKDAAANVFDSAAVLVGKPLFFVNGRNRFNLVYTEVCMKKDGKWKLVNIHTCLY